MTDLLDLPRDTTSGTVPVPWHWVYFFSESVANSRIGKDGHPARGDFLPAIRVERYPGIVVHGPLIATRLALLAARMTGDPVTWFSFRGKAPVFVDQPIQLIGRSEKNRTIALRAIRCDGALAMEATARTGYAPPLLKPE
jgi:3-methylfumaryl-CoA hydratase